MKAKSEEVQKDGVTLMLFAGLLALVSYGMEFNLILVALTAFFGLSGLLCAWKPNNHWSAIIADVIKRFGQNADGDSQNMSNSQGAIQIQ